MSSSTPGRGDPYAAAEELTAELATMATPERAASEQRYLKSSLEHLGVGVPQVRAAVRRLARTCPELGHAGVVELAHVLWAQPVHERRLAAVEVLAAYLDLLGSADLALIERLAREARTWALLDPLAISVAGGIVGTGRVTEPTVATALDRWAADPDFWVRRAALLALLPGLRRGGGDFDRFGRYADPMLDEREFFVRKAVGWVLREAGKRQPELVHAWLGPRLDRVSGVTFREAVRWLPVPLRDELCGRYRVGRERG